MQSQRRKKVTDYGAQLREKQRLRRHYGLREGQFRLFFQRAVRRRGVTGEQLLQSLELRLDNLVFRFGFAPSRRAARQFVRHGHVTLNGHKASIPSMVLKPGDVVTVKSGKSREAAEPYLKAAESRPVAPWLTLDREQFKGEVLHLPSRDEIAPVANEQVVVELYSK